MGSNPTFPTKEIKKEKNLKYYYAGIILKPDDVKKIKKGEYNFKKFKVLINKKKIYIKNNKIIRIILLNKNEKNEIINYLENNDNYLYINNYFIKNNIIKLKIIIKKIFKKNIKYIP
ncbi:hypothetical protein [Candidatus Vidania fulgoroideorum]